MQRSAVALLSLFFAFTAASTTTPAPAPASSNTNNYNQQMLDYINSLTTNPSTLPGSQTPSNAQLLNMLTSFMPSNTGTNTNPGSTSGAFTTNELKLLQASSGGSSSNPNTASTQNMAGSTNPSSNLLNNPMMLALSLRSDALRRTLMMSSLLGNTRQPGSMASQMSLMRGSVGDYTKSRMFDHFISQMATSTGMDPWMLAFMMPDMPDNYARNNFIGSLMGRQGTTTGLSGTGSGMPNNLFPLFFMRT